MLSCRLPADIGSDIGQPGGSCPWGASSTRELRAIIDGVNAELHARDHESGGRAARDIVVVGASAGGVEALRQFVAGFQPDLPAAIFVVLHVMPGGTSVLAQILQRHTRLLCAAAQNGDPIEPGRIYVAPPDFHMLLSDEQVIVTRGPRENGHRPAVDPLFRSAAQTFGRRVIGVVLSGALDDGTLGLRMIADAGGRALVQDPKEALYPSMPRSALEYVRSAEPLPVSDMAARICEMISRTMAGVAAASPTSSQAELTELEMDPAGTPNARLTDLTCPECGGTLWETEENGVTRFRCHVGHAYSTGSLDVSQSDALESALWGALRSLQERARLFRRLSQRADEQRSRHYGSKAEEAARHAEVLRSLIESTGRMPGEADEAATVGE